MRKPMLPFCLACAAVFTLFGGTPVSVLAATAVSTEEEESTGDSDETAFADNADLGADQISSGDDTEAAAESADTAISVPDPEDDNGMDKSSIGSAFDDPSYQFTQEDEDTVVYLIEEAEVLEAPSEEAEVLGILEKYDSVTLTGSNDLQYWEIEYEGEIAYIDSEKITREESDIEALKSEDAQKVQTEADSRQSQEEQIAADTERTRSEWEEALEEDEKERIASQTRNSNWSGAVLSPSKGSVYGPSGKETFYNLNMSGCIRNMNSRGYYGEVWVRNDGCKMFGDYIMCAANLRLHPYGSLVESSLGTCIVVDTGSFASRNPNQIDIAVTW